MSNVAYLKSAAVGPKKVCAVAVVTVDRKGEATGKVVARFGLDPAEKLLLVRGAAGETEEEATRKVIKNALNAVRKHNEEEGDREVKHVANFGTVD